MTQELNKTIDNGETEVQIATIGDVVGSASDGSPVDQKLTEDALKKLAEKHKDDELLVDADHESEVGGKTEAKGWLSGLKFVPGKGLFGKIHWTDIGKKLVENRVFRWLSPSWYLDKDTHEPVEMTSVALTNKPSQAGRIEPIVNSQPIELTDNKEEYEMTMTKEELVSLIKETVAVMNSEPTKVEEKTEEVVVENACPEEKAEEPVENECEKDIDVVKNEDTPEEVKEEVKEEIQEGKEEGKTEEEIKEEVKEEIVEEKKEESDDSEDAEQVSDEKKEEKKEEVIKLEALNSTPKTEGIDIVKNFAPTQTSAKGYAITTIVR